MRKLTNSKIEGVVVILMTIIFLLLVWIGIKESQVDRAIHLTECIKQCYPSDVDVESSRFNCFCIRRE